MQFHQCQPAASLKKRVMLCLITCLVLILPATGDSGVTLAQGQTFTIAGRITEVTPATGPAIPGVTVTLVINSSVQRTAQTNATGDFTFADVAAGSNFEVTPSKAGFVFQPTSQGGTNLNQNRMLFFTGAGSSPSTLQLVLEEFGPDPNQVVAVEAPHFTRDPLLVINPANVFANANDRNTRVVIFVANLQLAPGEPATSVVINLVDSLSQDHNIPAESVQSLPNFAQVTFRLPDNLAPGICSIKVTAHGLVSNIGMFRIKT